MKKFITKILVLALLAIPVGVVLRAEAATNWNTTGNYVVAENYLGSDYNHNVTLVQDGSGNLTGNGSSGPYTWQITSGTVTGNSIDFYANYTATADAVTPLTIMHMTGTIASDGTMSGNWSDNYQGGARSGTWATISGNAHYNVPIVLSSPTLMIWPPNENTDYPPYAPNTIFQANVNFDGGVTLSDFKAVEIRLYHDSTLLATNTAKPALFSSYPDAPGVTDLFGRGDTADIVSDPNWNIGAYSPNMNPNKVKFILTAQDDSVYEADGVLDAHSADILNVGVLHAEDFGYVNYNVGGGLGILKGYTAGFGVTDNTFEGATSVVVKLYSGPSESDLLQTNTFKQAKFNLNITGTQFSSPFDISGTFNYALDGYWTNVRQAEYGQSVPATRVVAIVTLANGKVVTAENTLTLGQSGNFCDVRRASDINAGPDLGGTGHMATNFTGSTGSAGDTWISLYDPTPCGSAPVINGSVTLDADVLIHPFNNNKGGGLLALYNTGGSGLYLAINDAGNTDKLVLSTVNATTGKLTKLTSIPLGAGGIAENKWYHLKMVVTTDGTYVTVTGDVTKHLVATDPNSAPSGAVGTQLSYTGLLSSIGVQSSGNVGLMANATSAVVDTSITNFVLTH